LIRVLGHRGKSVPFEAKRDTNDLMINIGQ